MEYFWMLQMALILLLPSVIYVYRHRGDRERALRGGGLALAITYTTVFGLFIAGETLFELGGWPAVGLTAAWLVPLVGLGLLAWRQPDTATPVLFGLLVAAAGVYAWSAFTAAAWTGFEDGNGPVRGIISFTLVGPIALLGWSRPRRAGLMLLALAGLPVLAVVGGLVTGASGGWPLLIVSAPALVVGLSYLASASMSGVGRAPSRPRRPDVPTSV